MLGVLLTGFSVLFEPLAVLSAGTQLIRGGRGGTTTMEKGRSKRVASPEAEPKTRIPLTRSTNYPIWFKHHTIFRGLDLAGTQLTALAYVTAVF